MHTYSIDTSPIHGGSQHFSEISDAGQGIPAIFVHIYNAARFAVPIKNGIQSPLTK